MSAIDSVLVILTGRKVREGELWRVYDATGNEIADAGGVLLQGLHGLLLNNQVVQQHVLASLGSSGKPSKARKIAQANDGVSEPISLEFVSRIRNEFLSESLAHDLIRRARIRKSRAEEEALLLMI